MSSYQREFVSSGTNQIVNEFENGEPTETHSEQATDFQAES